MGSVLPLNVAKGCLRPDGTDDGTYVAAGATLQTNLLWFKVLVPGVGVGYRYGSAIYLNSQYALTAAHGVTDLLQYNPTYQVGTGPNYVSNAGVVVSATVLVYPGFDPNNPGQTIDLAIVHFANPIPGPSVTITNTSADEVLMHAGFGMYGTPSEGEFPKDGNSRAWNAQVTFVPPLVGYTTNYYCATAFYPYIALNGKGLVGDSGGPVFDAATNLVGMMEAQVGDSNDIGETLYLNLSQPDISAWITSNTFVPPPVPVNIAIVQQGELVVSGPTNQTVELQASTDLVNWATLQEAAITNGSVVFFDPEATNFPARFYRAATQ